MIVAVTLDTAVPALVKGDDPHPTTFTLEQGYRFEEDGPWLRISHDRAPGARRVPMARVRWADESLEAVASEPAPAASPKPKARR